MIISHLLLYIFFLVRWSWGHCHLLRNVLQQSDLLFFDNGAVNIPYETNQGSASLHYQWPGHFWKQQTINKTARQHKQHHYAQNLQYMKDTLMNADWNPQYKKQKQTAMCQNDDEPQKNRPFSWDRGSDWHKKLPNQESMSYGKTLGPHFFLGLQAHVGITLW